jgi:NitT/TauT family transport system substrate-binding protein
MYVAQAEGFFALEGVVVEFIPVNAAPERDQLMQSGQIDAMLNEIVSVLLFNKDEARIIAVRFLRVATETTPVFRIVSAADSGITTIEDLKNVPIGIVPKIPDRLNLLASGQLKAANLPDPAASLAIFNGAQLVIDDRTYPEISHSVLSFSREFATEHPDTVRAFLRAVEQAVIEINADKGAWGTTLTENNLIPPPLLESYELPDYPFAGVPSEAQFLDALTWLLDAGLVDTEMTYNDSIDGSYLP